MALGGTAIENLSCHALRGVLHFGSQRYIRRMHLPPDTWGPFFWHTIHIVGLGYPNQPSYNEKKSAKEFFESLRFLIPCPVCRDHYTTHLEKFPLTPHLDKRSDLFRWTILLHNEVNKTLGKPTMTEAEVLKYYSRLGKRGRSPVWTLNDFVEADFKAMLQGLGIGFAVTAAAAGVLLYLNQDKP